MRGAEAKRDIQGCVILAGHGQGAGEGANQGARQDMVKQANETTSYVQGRFVVRVTS